MNEWMNEWMNLFQQILLLYTVGRRIPGYIRLYIRQLYQCWAGEYKVPCNFIFFPTLIFKIFDFLPQKFSPLPLWLFPTRNLPYSLIIIEQMILLPLPIFSRVILPKSPYLPLFTPWNSSPKDLINEEWGTNQWGTLYTPGANNTACTLTVNNNKINEGVYICHFTLFEASALLLLL